MYAVTSPFKIARILVVHKHTIYILTIMPKLVASYALYLMSLCVCATTYATSTHSEDMLNHVDTSPPVAQKSLSNPDHVMSLSCQTTPFASDYTNITRVNKSNNTWRKAGSGIFSDGQYIVVTGRVIDNHCTPVSNALIEISLKCGHNPTNYTDKDDQCNDNILTASALTDNLGYYRFYTIMPGSMVNENNQDSYEDGENIKSTGQLGADDIPYIQFVISHEELHQFRTQMFFPEERHSIEKNFMINAVVPNAQERKRLVAQKINDEFSEKPYNMDITNYKFDITLDGTLIYKE